MKSRFKIGIFLTVVTTLLLGLIWTMPVSADHVSTVSDTSQSTNSPVSDDSSRTSSSTDSTNNKATTTDNDTKTSKANQSSTSQSGASQATTNTSNNKSSSSSSTTTPASSTSNPQATSTVAVPVVSSSQQPVSQPTTAGKSDPPKAKTVKQVTLTTPNGAKITKHQELSQLALLPQTGKQTWLLTTGAVSLVWMPAIVIIFNTFI